MSTESYIHQLAGIKALFFDVDGVLTDGSVLLFTDGTQLRKSSAKDGYALQLAVKKGLEVAIITGGSSQEMKQRLQKLGVQSVYLHARNKLEVFEDHLLGYDIQPEECLYMGDDIPDYEVMKKVGLPTCPSDASPEIRKISKYVSPLKGGEGCVRDVIEKVLRAQNKWFDDTQMENFNEFTW